MAFQPVLMILLPRQSQVSRETLKEHMVRLGPESRLEFCRPGYLIFRMECASFPGKFTTIDKNMHNFVRFVKGDVDVQYRHS